MVFASENYTLRPSCALISRFDWSTLCRPLANGAHEHHADRSNPGKASERGGCSLLGAASRGWCGIRKLGRDRPGCRFYARINGEDRPARRRQAVKRKAGYRDQGEMQAIVKRLTPYLSD